MHERVFSTADEAIRHCLAFGPQFFLDMSETPPAVILIAIVRGDGTGCNLLRFPLDYFMTAIDEGLLDVSFTRYCESCDAWHD